MDELRTLFTCVVWVLVCSMTTMQMCTRNDCGLRSDLRVLLRSLLLDR
ncbi:hypothetical protein AMTRI_Chr02g261410 [Amborella trichopoda]